MTDTAEEVTSLVGASEEEDLQPVQADYFGFAATRRKYLNDRVSWVELKVLNEGERRKYLNETNREVKLSRNSGDAHLKMRPGDDKAALLQTAIVGWNLQRNGQPVTFNRATLEEFLKFADPRVVDEIDKEIRKMNPWLMAEMSVDDIRKEIADLEELLASKIAEEEGNGTSSNR